MKLECLFQRGVESKIVGNTAIIDSGSNALCLVKVTPTTENFVADFTVPRWLQFGWKLQSTAFNPKIGGFDEGARNLRLVFGLTSEFSLGKPILGAMAIVETSGVWMTSTYSTENTEAFISQTSLEPLAPIDKLFMKFDPNHVDSPFNLTIYSRSGNTTGDNLPVEVYAGDIVDLEPMFPIMLVQSIGKPDWYKTFLTVVNNINELDSNFLPFVGSSIGWGV